VGVGQPLRHLAADPQCFPERQAALREALGQGLSPEHLQHEVRALLAPADVEERDDVGVCEARRGLGLPEQPPSVAVLPFVDMSPANDQGYFADGVSEEILNGLARVEGLRVSGRSSSFWFRNKEAKLADIEGGIGAIGR
jgi:hypothetical protein